MNDWHDRTRRAARDRKAAWRARNPEAVAAETSARGGYWSRRRRDLREARPFVGCDGEGLTFANGYHGYTLLRLGETTVTPRPGEVRLRTTDILAAIANLPPEREYVGYYYGYDVAKSLEDLPFRQLERLVNRGKRVRRNGGFFPVDWNGFEIDWLSGKEFKVRRAGSPRWTIIHDVGSFFQCSFLRALETWDIGTTEERELIAAGKAMRGDFVNVPAHVVADYNALECRLLEELMTEFRAVCLELGYLPKKWQGPGVLAETVMDAHGIPANKTLPILQDPSEDGVAAFGRYAFYGGRSETTVVGPVTGCVRQFDINSAYPWALLSVPCLVHGKWRRNSDVRTIGDDELSLVFGKFEPLQSPRALSVSKPVEPNEWLYGLPIRSRKGNIAWPAYGRGWYWAFEIRSAIHQSFTSYDAWIYERHCDCRPFEFLKDIYALRQRIGKSRKGLVLKLLMNSMYGKLAQSVGSPKFSNPIWASFITAQVRAALNNAIHSLPGCADGECGRDVYYLATDGLFTADVGAYYGPARGTELGEWEVKDHPNGLFFIQSGLYFDPTGAHDPTFKTRGIPKAIIVAHQDDFVKAFGSMREWWASHIDNIFEYALGANDDLLYGTVRVASHTMGSIPLAVQRKTTKILGQFMPVVDSDGREGRRVTFNWSTKRMPFPIIYDTNMRTTPQVGLVSARDRRPIQTEPYSKAIGGFEIEEGLRVQVDVNQPDWLIF